MNPLAGSYSKVRYLSLIYFQTTLLSIVLHPHGPALYLSRDQRQAKLLLLGTGKRMRSCTSDGRQVIVAPVHPRRLTDLHRRRTVAEHGASVVVAPVAVAVVEAPGHSAQETTDARAPAGTSGTRELGQDVTSRVLGILVGKKKESFYRCT